MDLHVRNCTYCASKDLIMYDPNYLRTIDYLATESASGVYKRVKNADGSDAPKTTNRFVVLRSQGRTTLLMISANGDYFAPVNIEAWEGDLFYHTNDRLNISIELEGDEE